MQLLQCINLICPNFCFLWIVKKNFRPVSHTSLDLYKSIFLTEIYIHAIFLHLSNSNWSNSRRIPGFIFGLQQEIRTGSDGTEKIPFFEALNFFCGQQARGGGDKALVAGPIKKTQIFFCGFPNRSTMATSRPSALCQNKGKLLRYKANLRRIKITQML